MEWYPTVLRFVNAAFPSLRVTRRRTLILLTHAILQRRTLCQAELARALPGTTTHLHKKKRLHRFAKNEAIRPLTLLARMLAVVCQRFGFRRGQVPISLDWTPLREGEQALCAALPCEGRALPLLFWATSLEALRSGTSQNHLEEAFVRRLVFALPVEVWPVLVADRGFGRTSFLCFLQGLERQLGRRTSFVIRLAGRVMVEHGGERRLLRDWPLEPGEWLFLEGAYLRQDQALRVNLVLYWGRGCKEPWYLATDLGDPQQAVCLYGQRAWIDELFRDLKTHLGLEESRVAEVERLERLMLGLVVAYLVLALVGLSVVSRGFATRVISWGKASFIFLALEYVQGRDPPRVLLRWKEVR